MNRFESSLHRGAHALTWYRQGVMPLEDALRDVAHELARSLQVQNRDTIIPPPGDTATAGDRLLADSFSKNGRNSYGGVFVVANQLTVEQAVALAKTMHNTYGERFSGIGCGELIVPEGLAEKYTIFPDSAWQLQLRPAHFIPLRRCITSLDNA